MIKVFLKINQLPIHVGLLWTRREDALQAPKGEIKLGYCITCGHVFNLSFNPDLTKYNHEYDNSLFFSPRFQRYASSLAQGLIERYELTGKDIIEIGSGRGDFLKLLCELGNNRGIGFDPSYSPRQNGNQDHPQIKFIRDYYSERYSNYKADLLCARHTLEHVYRPTAFLAMLCKAMGNTKTTVFFFEVPNIIYTLRKHAIWDIIYEHFSYFSPSSLAHLFKSFGFEILNLNEVFQRQFLSIEASFDKRIIEEIPQETNLASVDDTASLILTFADKFQQKIEEWQNLLEKIKNSGKRAVIWGAGAKGISFLNLVDVKDEIEFAIDINPHKQGKYIAGTGQKIVAPNFLCEHRPDIVIVMNSIYDNEIRHMIKQFDIAPEIIIP